MSEADHCAAQKWTELELLPEWDEEYYDVYTAKKAWQVGDAQDSQGGL